MTSAKPTLSPWREGREEEGMEGGSWEKGLEKKRKSEQKEEGERGWGGESENEYPTLFWSKFHKE